MSDEEIEFDFTVVDRVEEHLKGHDTEKQLPEWFESNKGLQELYSSDSLDKAIALIKGNKVEHLKDGLYDVKGSTLYTCNVVEFENSESVPGVTCTCPNGSHRTGRPNCYHSAAALIVHMKLDVDELRKSL